MRDVIAQAKAKIKGKGLRLVLPEADDPRIEAAAERLKAEGWAVPLTNATAPLGAVSSLMARRPSL
jgi:phosphotransacetylase